MTSILELLTNRDYFPHVLAVLVVGIWALAILTRPAGFYRPRALGLVVVPLAIAPYMSTGLGLAVLALGFLVVTANLDHRWLAWAPDRANRAADGLRGPSDGRAAGVASGVLFFFGGMALMVLSGGASAWSWWIGLGTAAHGGLIVLTRMRGVRDFGPWS